MLLNPRTAIDEGWIQFPEWMTEKERNKCIQPNAIDITLDKLFIVDSNSIACITENNDEKKMRPCLPVEADDGGFFTLNGGILYDAMSDFYVTVPDNVACNLIIRSTFNRAGVHLENGLYDSHFFGNIGFTLYNRSGNVLTKPGTRIAQIMFTESQSVGKYAGGYCTPPGEHWQKNTITETNNKAKNKESVK